MKLGTTKILTLLLVLIFTKAQAQDFNKSEAYKNFFRVDMGKLQNSQTHVTEGDKLQKEASKKFNELRELKEKLTETESFKDKTVLQKKINDKKKEAYNLQEQAYAEYQKSNEIKYKIYNKHYSVPWKNASSDDYDKRKKIRVNSQSIFSRAKSFRLVAQNLQEEVKMQSLYKADSLETVALSDMEQFLEKYLNKKIDIRTASPFRNTDKFRMLFAADMKKLNTSDKKIHEGDSLIQAGNISLMRSGDIKKLAEEIKRRRKRKKTLAQAEELYQKGIKQQTKGYNLMADGHKIRYEIYNKYIENFRVKANPERLSQGVKMERQIGQDWKQAMFLRTESQKFANKQKIKTLAKSDSLQIEYIGKMEVILGVYNDYNRKEKNIDIDMAENALSGTTIRLSKLISECPFAKAWTTDIENYHQNIIETRDKVENTKDINIKRIYLNQIYHTEQQEAKSIDEELKKTENKNEAKFKDYKNKISALGFLNEKQSKYQKGRLLEKDIQADFNRAKTKIHQAQILDKALEPKLVKEGAMSPLEKFQYLEVLKYRLDKYETVCLLLEAKKIQNGTDEKIDKLLEIYKRIRLNKVPGKNMNGNVKSNNKKTGTEKSNKKRNSKKKYKKNSKIYFNVQLASFKEKHPLKNFTQYDTTKIIVEKLNNGYAYLDGRYKWDEAQKALNKAHNSGYTDAYIVAYENGKKITVKNALSKINKNIKYKSQSSVITNIGINPKRANEKVKAKEINKIKGKVYTIQIGTFRNEIKRNKIKNLTGIYKEKKGNKTIYTAGLFRTEAAAAQARKKVTKAGIKKAFVVAYYNGKRISLSDIKYKTQTKNTDSKDICFRVQIAAGNNTPSVTEEKLFERLGKYGTLNRFKTGSNRVIYTIGYFKNYKKAIEIRNKIVKEGVQDAFVIAMKGNKEIAVNDAIKILR